tara:strand:- start:205 stop:453 length:249 start_codon:yes stop_codon:yes gene_type:complete
MNWRKVLYLPIFFAGNPLSRVPLNADIKNSLINIIDRDQNGITSFLQSQTKGIIIKILSAKGSKIAPILLLSLNFLAKYPSK